MTKILLRRNTASFFSSTNPILASGEPAFAIDTNVLKIGDGIKGWNSLSAISSSGTGGGGSEINDLTSAVTWANVPDANITESSVVQHSGALRITESQITDLRPYLLNVVEDTSPQLGGNLDGNNFNISGVPYLTATSGTLDVLSFNVNNESILTKGQISWDDTEGTMDIGLTANSTIHVGEHRYFRIRNQTGSPLYKGQVVYATGVHSNGLISPAKYVADGTVREVRFMGVVLEDVNDNNNGYVIDFGHLENMDLSGGATNYAYGDETWLNGDVLYVHPTIPGKLTKYEPKHSISVAIILDNSSNGRMFVRPTSYGHLDDNHDVAVSGATNGQFLQYNSVADYWVPSSSGNFSTLQVNNTHVSVSGHTHTSTEISDFNSAVNSLLSAVSIPDGDKGDITVSESGTIWSLDDNSVTNAKLSNMSNNTIKGRISTGEGDPEDLTVSQTQSLLSIVPSGGNISSFFNDAGYLTTATAPPSPMYTNGSGLLLISDEFSIDNTVVVTLTDNQTLYNKTLIDPIISGGSGNFTSGLYVNGAPVIKSDITSITGASGVNNIVIINSGDYDLLGTYDPLTIYFIK